MWRLIIIVLFFFVVTSCASQERKAGSYVPANLYNLSIAYSYENKAFIFSFTSLSDDEICIPKMSWPDENGRHYFFEDRRVYFMDRGIRYDIQDLSSGYCTSLKKNGCVHVIKKNGQLFGRLRIEDFVITRDVFLSENFSPQLQYPYKPYFCEGGKN